MLFQNGRGELLRFGVDQLGSEVSGVRLPQGAHGRGGWRVFSGKIVAEVDADHDRALDGGLGDVTVRFEEDARGNDHNESGHLTGDLYPISGCHDIFARL